MAIEQKIVCVCDICGFMVEANGDGIGCASTPETWEHGKNGNIDICPKCAKKLERPEWNYRGTGGTRNPLEKGFRYSDVTKK